MNKYNNFKGRFHTEETKQKIRESRLGKPRGTKIGNNIKCGICNKEFYVMPSLEKTKKTCSKECYIKFKSIQAKELGYGKWMIGKKLSKESIEKQKKTKMINRNRPGYINPMIGHQAWNKGIKHTNQHKKNLIIAKENENERPWARTGSYYPCVTCYKSLVYIGDNMIKRWINGKGSLPYCSKKCSPQKKPPVSVSYRKTHPISSFFIDNDILESFIINEMTLKEIANKYNMDRNSIKKILKNNGIEEEIYIRWKKRIGSNTKEHRKYQIFPVKDTSIEIKMQNLLNENNIEFEKHKYIKDIKHGYQCDIFIPKKKLVIECDGNYWHNRPFGRKIDITRSNELRNAGYKVLRFWEAEIKPMQSQDLMLKLNKIQNKRFI